ncbi:MAG: InlB B-repeat-containing protein, partial [Candidatus Nanopelagicales bacterium]|nr:InlB B-repeat-containing protein [Candidatus Nanopelagicales bacterium]
MVSGGITGTPASLPAGWHLSPDGSLVPYEAALSPVFDAPVSTGDGFTVNVTNYDGAFTWGATATGGGVSIDGSGLVTVTGLDPGAGSTVTVTTTRTGYHDGAATVGGTAITGAALTPEFDAPVSTADGFTVNVSNYNSDFTWPAPTVTEGGTATAGTADGSVLPITVTDLAPGQSADLTVTTTRTGYHDGTATVGGAALDAALTPAFDAPVSTADGFTVNVTNYNSDFTWPAPTVTEDGTATAGTADGSVLPITVTDLAPGQSADLTVTTTRTWHAGGAATVTGTAITGAALTPTFDAPVSTADGFTVNVTNYNSDYTWPAPTVTAGTATVGTADGSVLPITVTDLAPGQSADLTVTTTRTGYHDGTATVSASALPNHTVTFDKINGTGSMSPQVANVPTALTANAFTPPAGGYSFKEWTTEVGGGGDAYADGAEYAFDDDVTLYAQW